MNHQVFVSRPCWPSWSQTLRSSLVWGLLICSVLPGTFDADASATLQVRLLSVSVQCQNVQTNVAGVHYSLGVGSPPFDVETPNGDLAPVVTPSTGDPAHLGSLYVLQAGADTYYDDFFLTSPEYRDMDGDGIDDFFEASMGISGISSAGYIEDGVQGTEFPLHATWYREAGVSSGYCKFILQNANLPRPVPFLVPFEILNFSGVFISGGPATNVAGTVFLRQSDHFTNTLLGTLEISIRDRDTLEVSPGGWIHSNGTKAEYLQSTPLRRQGTNYVGVLAFDHGLPAEQDAHRRYWILSLSDSRDYNSNGIPDLSDPVPAASGIPRLTIGLEGDHLTLHLLGKVGDPFILQQCTDLSLGDWRTVASGGLMEPDQQLLVPLPLPSSRSYWRVKAP